MITRRDDIGSATNVSCGLFHVIGSLPTNCYGCPVVNLQGRVVAVYVEMADLSHDATLSSLAGRYHYVLDVVSINGLLDVKSPYWRLVYDSSDEN
jgi:hypothetical protein